MSVDDSVDVSDRLAGSLGATWSHVGNQSGDFSSTGILNNNPRLPAYNSVDLRVGLAFRAFRVDLLARDITDSHGLVTYRYTAGFNAQTGSGVIIQPRTFAARLSATF